ncbi:response regulator [Pseudomonas sp. EggHat1]|uniref:response regulator n=1 Tax=Pseudomonas sp. EggHat1 TaxID=2761624 RepID=UPI00186610D9|nr:response regulator [Pseudomonas sp. EggHat1]
MRALKILLLEHNPYQLLAMHQQLNACGIYQVMTADDTAQAADLMARRGSPDILISDLQPDDEARLAWLKQLSEQRAFYALIVHGNSHRAQLEQATLKARQVGIQALGFLQKPSAPPALRRLLESYKAISLLLPVGIEPPHYGELQSPSTSLCLQNFPR